MILDPPNSQNMFCFYQNMGHVWARGTYSDHIGSYRILIYRSHLLIGRTGDPERPSGLTGLISTQNIVQRVRHPENLKIKRLIF